MQIGKLDHVNVRTSQLDTMVKWYAEILGMNAGFRPNFPFAGAWLYAGDHAAVHLVEVDDAPGVGSESDLKLEHFAFSAQGGAEFETKLKQASVRFEKIEVPGIDIVQFNIWDPDGNHIHIDFSLTE